MAKKKSPDLADWEVTILGSGELATVRASHHEVRDGSVILSSASGHALFSAPASCTIARRVSDEDRKAQQEAREEAAMHAERLAAGEPLPPARKAAGSAPLPRRTPARKGAR